nr:DNA repair protein RAD51 homolog 2-like [Lytechinus pictus]
MVTGRCRQSHTPFPAWFVRRWGGRMDKEKERRKLDWPKSRVFYKNVVVTNQITTHYTKPVEQNPVTMETDDTESFSVATSDGGEGHVTTALGNTWSHNVNTRLILQYLDEVHREILIAKSPLAPFAKVIYTIQDAGLVSTGRFNKSYPFFSSSIHLNSMFS